MSTKATTWAYQHEILSNDKFVLVALADNANENWYAWPSITLLVRKTCLDHRTVQRALRRLEDSGYIEDTGHRIGNTKQIRVYKLKAGMVPPLKGGYMPLFGGHKDGTTPPLKGVTGADKGCHPCTERVSPVPREPSGTVMEPPSAVSLSGDSQPKGELVHDFETAKALICKLILGGKNPARPWNETAERELTKQLPIPLIEIARISWFRNLPDDPTDPDLCVRKACTENGLCAYWSDEFTRANLYWRKVHGSGEKKKEPPRWREFFVWKNGDRVVLPDSFWQLDLCYRDEYEQQFTNFVKANQ